MKTCVSARHETKGFTLIELMVTITIGAILAAIAVPAYTSQVRKSRRTEARSAVLDAAAREERFFATNSMYSAAAKDLGYSALPTLVGSNFYQLSAVCTDVGTACSGFQLTATPQGTQVKDTQCLAFTVDDTGKQTVSGSAAADPTAPCWN
jgi:type IV pilus assembly protein PilE